MCTTPPNNSSLARRIKKRQAQKWLESEMRWWHSHGTDVVISPVYRRFIRKEVCREVDQVDWHVRRRTHLTWGPALAI